jgi:hypothetical protein
VLVDYTSTDVTDNSSPTGSRAIFKSEVLAALRQIEEQIVRGNWPPP